MGWYRKLVTRDSQPSQSTHVQSYFKKAEIAWLGSSNSVDVDNNKKYTRDSGLTNVVTKHGEGVNFVGNTTNSIHRSGGKTSFNKVTFVSVFKWLSGGANNYPQLMGLSSANSGYRIGSNLSGGGDLCLTKGGVVALNTITITSGVTCALVTSHREDTGEYYIKAINLDTQAITSNTQTNTASSIAGNGVYSVGTGRTDFSGSFNGDIYFAYANDRFLPSTIADQLLENIWQMFEPRVEYFPLAAGGGPTINPLIFQSNCNGGM